MKYVKSLVAGFCFLLMAIFLSSDASAYVVSSGYTMYIYCPFCNYKSFPPESIYFYKYHFYKYHRHYKVSVDVFSQSYEDMDVTLRRLAQNFYVVRRSLVPFCIVARRIRRKVGVDEQTKQIADLYSMGLPVLDTKRIFSPPLWKLFNSYSRKELPQKDWERW